VQTTGSTGGFDLWKPPKRLAVMIETGTPLSARGLHVRIAANFVAILKEISVGSH